MKRLFALTLFIAAIGWPASGSASGFNGLDVVRPRQGIAIPLGRLGAFDAGEVRDPSVVYARGEYWCAYTGLAVPNGTVAKVGLASSEDGVHWHKWGVIINTNTVPNTWWSGGVASPALLYDPLTDQLWVFVSGATNAMYGGGRPTWQIGVLRVATGGSWTNGPLDYHWMNNTNPLPLKLGFEDQQGDYAPCSLFANANDMSNGMVTMYWSIKTNYVQTSNGTQFKLPTDPATTITVTNFPNNPLPVGYGMKAEEPDVFPAPGGGFVNLAAADNKMVVGGAAPVYYTPAPSGQSNWVEELPFYLCSGDPVFRYAGSSSVCAKPDGNLLVLYTVLTNANEDTAYSVICSETIRFEPPHSMLNSVDTLHVNRMLEVGGIANAGGRGLRPGENSQDNLSANALSYFGTPTLFSTWPAPFVPGYGTSAAFEFLSTNGIDVRENPYPSHRAGHIGLGGNAVTFDLHGGLLGITNRLGDIVLAPKPGTRVVVPATLSGTRFAGNGVGLTNISATSISGGMTTSIDVPLKRGGTVMLHFVNGILVKVSRP